jgi:SAM-dependent methyltransferase
MRDALHRLIYRHRRIGKQLVATASRCLPGAASSRLRALAEQMAFRVTPQYQGETLPPIFGYWASAHIAPAAARLGISSPESFFLDELLSAPSNGRLRILSVGSGACAMERQLAHDLRAAGIDFELECIDFNRTLIDAARQAAEHDGLGNSMRFTCLDCNGADALPVSDVIIVNQFFHHVERLEDFVAAIAEALAIDGRLLSSDVIGRNGHALWPSAAAFVDRWWRELRESQRYDRYFEKRVPRYTSVDHSTYSHEGVRAQDIVPILLQHFDFETFFAFGGGIMPFVERRLGFNFNPNDDADRNLIDRIHADDAANVAAARYPAAKMIASLRRKRRAVVPRYEPISPDDHVAATARERSLIGAGAISRESA